MKRILIVSLFVVGTALVAACGSTSNTAPAQAGSATPGLVNADDVLPLGATPVQKKAAAAASDAECHGRPTTASLAPSGLPAPGHMPTGSLMATIAARPNGGYLNAGVDQNTLQWGYLNPATRQLEGFDIDMVKQVAEAIFGPDYMNHLRFVIVPNVDRQAYVANGTVDLVAETMTITCGRQNGTEDGPKVFFSSEYYDAHQEVLVAKGSPIHTLDDLNGKRVCADIGSTSLATVKYYVPRVQLWEAPNETDCLVMLQQGQVDAISTDDTILNGFIAQDHNLQILGNQNGPITLSDEPYGMAVSTQHPEFVQFVNAVLSTERVDQKDGTWANLWRLDLEKPVVTFPAVPYRSS